MTQLMNLFIEVLFELDWVREALMEMVYQGTSSPTFKYIFHPFYLFFFFSSSSSYIYDIYTHTSSLSQIHFTLIRIRSYENVVQEHERNALVALIAHRLHRVDKILRIASMSQRIVLFLCIDKTLTIF
jgi:hypothetical protein